MQTHMSLLYLIPSVLAEQLRRMIDGEVEVYRTENGEEIDVCGDDDGVDSLESVVLVEGWYDRKNASFGDGMNENVASGDGDGTDYDCVD